MSTKYCCVKYYLKLQSKISKSMKKIVLPHPLPVPPKNCSQTQPKWSKNGCSLSMIKSFTIGKSMDRRFQKDKNVLTCVTQKLIVGPKWPKMFRSQSSIFKYDHTYTTEKLTESRFEIWILAPFCPSKWAVISSVYWQAAPATLKFSPIQWACYYI